MIQGATCTKWLRIAFGKLGKGLHAFESLLRWYHHYSQAAQLFGWYSHKKHVNQISPELKNKNKKSYYYSELLSRLSVHVVIRMRANWLWVSRDPWVFVSTPMRRGNEDYIKYWDNLYQHCSSAVTAGDNVLSFSSLATRMWHCPSKLAHELMQ